VNAKTVSERVQALRQRREDKGLTRLELYAHTDDHAAIKKKAEQLQRNRERTEVNTTQETGRWFVLENRAPRYFEVGRRIIDAKGVTHIEWMKGDAGRKRRFKTEAGAKAAADNANDAAE
jgi:hypothetical protein